MRKQLIVIMTCVLFCAAVAVPVAAEDDPAKKFPFFPSLLNTESGNPLKTDDFESPEICSGCHTGIFKQWKGSMHSSAFVDPVFQALWKLGESETKGLTNNLCGGCHAGVGVVANDLTFKDGAFQTSDLAKEGVHCDFCHTVKGSSFLETPTHEPQNASLVVAPGSVKRAQYKDSDSPHHDTAYSGLHTKSEFCANCHQVYHPLNNFHIERTYDEWKYSIYAQNGIQCQDCHMMPVEKAIEAARTLKKSQNPGKPCIMGPDRANMYTHEFVGANFTVPTLLGHKEHAGIATKRLQSAAALELEVPQRVKGGDMVQVAVKVTNVGAGHNLPTSLTEVRQMWLDVQVVDAAGKELFRSGNLDAAGNIINDGRIFNAKALDKDGHHTVKPWEIVRFDYNNAIPPKGTAVERYTLLAPKDASGTLTVKAVLRYRSYPQAVANLLLGEGAPTLPVVDMVQQQESVTVVK